MEDIDLELFASQGLRFTLPAVGEGYFTSDDARLHFSCFGFGRPLILLHGGMGNGTNWAGQIKTLVDAGYNPIVLDTRGHGRSSPGSIKFSYHLLSQDVNRLMEHLGLLKAILVGWSDGACTALEMAKTTPSRVVGVVFFACNVDPSGTREFEMTSAIQNCLTRHRLDFERMSPTFESFDDLQPKLAPMQQYEPNYSADELSTIQVPIVVLQGEKDEFIKLSHARYLADTLPNAHLEIMEEVGHFAPIQDPGMFNKVLLKCIQKVESRHLTKFST